METTNPYPPPVSPPHEELENNNLQPPIAASPVDDVARNHEQFMDSILPEKSVDHRQSPVGDEVESEVFVQSPMEVIEEVEYHHQQQQLLNSISPENLVDCQIQPPPEHAGVQQEPPATEADHPSENLSPNRESPLSKKSPSLSPSPPPPENPSPYKESSLEHVSSNYESPVSKQPPSPSPPPGYSPENVNSNNESQLLKQPPSPLQTVADYPPENLVLNHKSPPENINPNNESPLSKKLPSPTLSPSPPPTEAEYLPENISPNHESPVSKQPQSPSLSLSPAAAEAAYPPENFSPKHESLAEDFSPNHESPLSKQPQSPSPTVAEESTLLKPQPSPSRSPSPIGTEEPPESPKLKQSPKDLSPSPPLTIASPPHDILEPKTRTPPLGVPLLLHAATTFSSPTKPHISPWTHQETANLIQAYQEKWYSLKKGPLKAGQWEEVAITVAEESTLLKPQPSPSRSPSPIGTEEPPESPKLKQSPKDLSPSPPLTIASPPHDILEPKTRTPPLGVPLLLHAATTFSSPTKPHISPWTHQETANLIQAYQEKWYSLKKGPLKAGQWEEVAITVAARCGYDEPTKTSKQCRHKIEKLRKRYRTERGKPRSKATAWNFFKLMDNLEKGPLPISSSQPMELVEYQKPSTSNSKKRKNDVYDDDEFLANKRSSTSRARNSNHYVANGGLATNLRFSEGGNRIVRGLRTPVIHKRKEVYREEREEENNENVCEEEEQDVAGQLAAEIKGFAEKFVKMEKNKIEMMRDVERYRLEMENKRMEMIIESQQMLVETVNNAFGSSVKTHRLSAS